MKQKATNYEVLLVTSTSFSKRQFCERDSQQPNDSLTGQLQGPVGMGWLLNCSPTLLNAFPKKRLLYMGSNAR
jgi:hypothetical protein